MKKFWILLRTLMRSTYGRGKKGGNGVLRMVGYGLLMVFASASFISMFTPAAYLLFSAAGPEAAVTVFGGFLSLMMVMALFMSMRTTYGLIGEARDTEFLLSLPLGRSTIFSARLATGYPAELAVQCFFVLPVMLGYWLYARNPAGIVAGVIMLLTVPLLTLGLSSMVTLLLLKITNNVKAGVAFFNVLLTLALLAMVFGLQFLLGSGDAVQAQDLNSISAILAPAAKYIPVGGWMASGVARPFSPGFWLYLLAVGSAYALAVVLGSRIYDPERASMDGKARKKRKASGRAIAVRSGSAIAALVKKEIRTVLRSGTFASNLLAGVIMGPIMGVSMGMGMRVGGSDDLLAFLSPELICYFAAGLMAFTLSICPVSSTALSREGRCVWLPLSLPVSSATVLWSKFIPGIGLSLLEALVCGVVFSFVLPGAPFHLWLGIAVGTLAALAPQIVSSLPDFYKPKLNWSTEREAVKNNWTVVLSMFLIWLLLIPHVILLILLRNHFLIGCAASLLLSIAELAILARLMPRIGYGVYYRLQHFAIE